MSFLVWEGAEDMAEKALEEAGKDSVCEMLVFLLTYRFKFIRPKRGLLSPVKGSSSRRAEQNVQKRMSLCQMASQSEPRISSDTIDKRKSVPLNFVEREETQTCLNHVRLYL